MIRVFFNLYLAVLVPLAALLLLPSNPLNGLFNRWAETVIDEQYAGTFYLVERELENLPVERWPAQVEALAANFGRELKIVPIDAEAIPAKHHARLRDVGQVFISQPTPRIWRRIRDSGYALQYAFAETKQEEAHRDANGTAYLIKKYLETYADVHQGLRDLAPHFGFPLALKRMQDVELGEAEREAMQRGRMVRVDLEPGREMFYGKIDREDWVIVAGPLDDHALSQRVTAAFALLPALLLALAVLFWLRPLWRDLRRLNATATSFGQGDLRARSALSRRSTLKLLSTSFNDMADSIQRSIEGQRELTHAVSHEFKTPVARLRFALEMLRENPADADRERYLDVFERDIGELEVLIGELLTHARYDRADLALKLAPVNFDSWLSRRVADFQDCHPRLRIEIERQNAPEEVVMDERAMDKLINNLLGNAVRYASVRVRVIAGRTDGDVLLVVEDDGPGIPEADREAVFRPFFRVDSSREREAGGSGLGLAIVKRVAERHGGAAHCEASALGGARLVVRWPVRSKEDTS